MSDSRSSPVAIRLAAALVVLLAVGVAVVGMTLGSGDPAGPAAGPTAGPTSPAPRTGPVALVAVDAPDAGSAECASLLAALPAELPDGDDPLPELPLAEPAPAGATAWGGDTGEPVVLRCGLARPAELTGTSPLRAVSEVQWLPVPGDAATTWYLVDRAVYVALTIPTDTGTGPLQEISATVARTLAPAPVRTGG